MTTKRKRNALSAVFVQSVQETGTYADGGGLNLRVEDSGAKFWFQRVTIDGKRRNLGLGGYPTVSLAEARKAALVNSRMIREGRDPLAEKREAITARQRPPTPTFAEASEIVIDMRRPTWTNAKHAEQWTNTLTTYASPKLGPLRVPQARSKTGHRYHQRGHPVRTDADMDREGRDGQPGPATHGNGAGLGRRPGLPNRQSRHSFNHQGVAQDAPYQAALCGAALPRRSSRVGNGEWIKCRHRHQVGVRVPGIDGSAQRRSQAGDLE